MSDPTNFVFPSDADRAENDELNRVCEYAENLIEELDRLRAYTSDTDQWTRKLEQTVLEISEECDQLKAQVNALTSAISASGVYKTSEELCDLMHSTPVQCLTKHDAEVIKRMLLSFAQNGLPCDEWGKSCEHYANQLHQQAKEVQS